jgi:hypothetical protein
MKNSLLVFGTKNFNILLNEIKEYLDFTLVFFNDDNLFSDTIFDCSAILVDGDFCNNATNLGLINSVNNKPILLVMNGEPLKKFSYTDKIALPLILSDFNARILNLISSEKFNQNSSLKIKEYSVDKNEKKLKKNYLSISITEREIQLIELLFREKKPLSKNVLLKKIWKYSENADTHTVQTHVYRLRKKAEFKDKKFIINSKAGYSI